MPRFIQITTQDGVEHHLRTDTILAVSQYKEYCLVMTADTRYAASETAVEIIGMIGLAECPVNNSEPEALDVNPYWPSQPAKRDRISQTEVMRELGFSCKDCRHCGMDMTMDPYCAQPVVLKTAEVTYGRNFASGLNINDAFRICNLTFWDKKPA